MADEITNFSSIDGQRFSLCQPKAFTGRNYSFSGLGDFNFFLYPSFYETAPGEPPLFIKITNLVLEGDNVKEVGYNVISGDPSFLRGRETPLLFIRTSPAATGPDELILNTFSTGNFESAVAQRTLPQSRDLNEELFCENPEFLELGEYVPQLFRNTRNLLQKSVRTFNDILNLDPDIVDSATKDLFPYEENFEARLNQINDYWDYTRKDVTNQQDIDELFKARDVLDPFGITDLIATDVNRLKIVLYYLSEIYSRKGSSPGVSLILRLLGLTFDYIPWYNTDEFLRYAREVKICHLILKIGIGNNQLTQDFEEKLLRLFDNFIDYCAELERVIFIKNVRCDIDVEEQFDIEITEKIVDRYNYCCQFILPERYYAYCNIPFFRKTFDEDAFSTRFLDPDEANPWFAEETPGGARLIYDPREGDPESLVEKRTPFAELPVFYSYQNEGNFYKPVFQPLYENPTYGHAVLLHTLHLLQKPAEFTALDAFWTANQTDIQNDFPEIASFLEETSTISSFMVAANGLLPANIDRYDLFYTNIHKDDYRFYGFAGIDVNPAVIEFERELYLGSPYFCYTDPIIGRPPLYYSEDDECVWTYDGLTTYRDPLVINDPDACITFYKQETYITYEETSADAFPYDGTVCYNTTVDFPYYPHQYCPTLDATPLYPQGEGLYPISRYGMPLDIKECHFIYGFVDGVKNQEHALNIGQIVAGDYTTDFGDLAAAFDLVNTNYNDYVNYLNAAGAAAAFWTTDYRDNFITYWDGVLGAGQGLALAEDIDCLLVEQQITDVFSEDMYSIQKAVKAYSLKSAPQKEFVKCNPQFLPGALQLFAASEPSYFADALRFIDAGLTGFDLFAADKDDPTCEPIDYVDRICDREHFTEQITNEALVDSWGDTEICYYHDGSGDFIYVELGSEPETCFYVEAGLEPPITEDFEAVAEDTTNGDLWPPGTDPEIANIPVFVEP